MPCLKALSMHARPNPRLTRGFTKDVKSQPRQRRAKFGVQKAYPVRNTCLPCKSTWLCECITVCLIQMRRRKLSLHRQIWPAHSTALVLGLLFGHLTASLLLGEEPSRFPPHRRKVQGLFYCESPCKIPLPTQKPPQATAQRIPVQ